MIPFLQHTHTYVCTCARAHAHTHTHTHTEFGAGVTLPSMALQHYGQIPLQAVQDHTHWVFIDRVFSAQPERSSGRQESTTCFDVTLSYFGTSLVTQLVKNPLQCWRPGFDPWVRKIPWRRKGYPLPYSGLENSMDCIVSGVSESQTRLSYVHFHFSYFASRDAVWIWGQISYPGLLNTHFVKQISLQVFQNTSVFFKLSLSLPFSSSYFFFKCAYQALLRGWLSAVWEASGPKRILISVLDSSVLLNQQQ